MEFTLRPMVMEDIPQVVTIEKKSFPTPWSPYAFACELSDNDFAYYLVVNPAQDPKTVVGYGGMWLIIDEAHVTNIAITPAYRGKALGELLLRGMIELALSKNILRMTLEVRPSNLPAQKLYNRLGFKAAGIRPGYYADTNEDAIIMWCDITKVNEVETCEK